MPMSPYPSLAVNLPHSIIQRLQYRLATGHTGTVALRTLAVEHTVGGIVVDTHSGAVDHAEAIAKGIEGEGTGVAAA